MRNYETKTIERECLVSVTCDVCKETYDDDYELQEFVNLHFIAGYLSVFGDDTEVDIDICQHCLYEMIKDYIK